MTRLQKKCFLVSVGLHGLLLLVLVGTSAFRSRPSTKDIPILTMIPANILDQAGAGGGSPETAVAPPSAPQPLPPASPVVPTPQPVAPQHATEAVEHVKPQPVERQPEPQPEPQPKPQPEPETKPEPEKEATTKPAHKTHEVRPSFALVNSTPSKTKTKTSEPVVSDSSSSPAARRLQRQIAQSLDALASGVKTSGASGTVVDMPGQGGGEAFAGYETVVYNVYYHAWITPDSVADKQAATDVKIVVARDGAILSAEIVNKSGERALDKSVDRVLRAVTKLPPFPAAARDEQRSFVIRFNLESKEGSG
jgi:periplasmic protein TonB